MVTKEDVKAALEKLQLVAMAMHDAKEIPSGELYAILMGKFSLVEYQRCIGILKDNGLVKEVGFLLTWTGPNYQQIPVKDQNSGATAQVAG
jgi:hypothetical protein